jgi:lipoprotein-releasing system ATP-binding protein
MTAAIDRVRPVMPLSEPIIRAEALTKTYAGRGLGHADLDLFRDLNLAVAPGELVAIVGQSGAGKSSLLHLLAALDRPTAGEVTVAGRRLGQLSAAQAAHFRNRDIGYVWQFHYLLPEFTAQENVAMPLLAQGVARVQALARAGQWLQQVGLADRAQHRSGELSGGEQQRISLARALVTEPRVLLADEPTGDLDEGTAEAVFTLIQRLHRAHALTSVLVTHSLAFAARCDRTLTLRRGRLE